METYIYIDHDGLKKKITLTPEQGKKWVAFCINLIRTRKNDPLPNNDDYIKFIQEQYPDQQPE